jgi:hypothetical protein
VVIPLTGAISQLSTARFARVTAAGGAVADPDEDVAEEQAQLAGPGHGCGQIGQVVF